MLPSEYASRTIGNSIDEGFVDVAALFGAWHDQSHYILQSAFFHISKHKTTLLEVHGE